MPVGFDSIRAGAAGAAGGYEIDYSCRFNDNDNAYLQKTFGSPTDATNWTFSCWIKRCTLGTEQYFFHAGGAIYIRWGSDNKIRFRAYPTWDIETTAVFRDTSAWYHLVAKFANGAVTLYMNNTSVGSASVSDSTFTYFTNVAHAVGNGVGGGSASDHYMAECIGIDGTAYNPSDFGETNADTGEWVPIDPSGLTFGNNGFWLDFADSSALGNDVSGNNNDFTSTALATNDQVTDTPTTNCATFNPLSFVTAATLSNGNLVCTAGAAYLGHPATMPIPTTGKWAFKMKVTGAVSGSNDGTLGFVADAYGNYTVNSSTGVRTDHWYNGVHIGYFSGGNVRHSFSGAYSETIHHSGTATQTNDEYEFLVDRDSGTVDIKLNGSAYGSQLTGLPSTTVLWPHTIIYSTEVTATFSYTPSDTTYLALCAANLPDPTIKDPSAYAQATIYTGNATASRAITQDGNSQFGPDLVWIKNRSQNDEWKVLDTTRGATKEVNLDSNGIESTDANGLTAFSATDGFTLGTGAGGYNDNGENFVAYQWEEGVTPGFDIVQYTGNGGGSQTISHSLGVKPEMMVVKDLGRNSGGNVGHYLYHHKINPTPEDYYMTMHDGAISYNASIVWNDTAPTSSQFTVGNSVDMNESSETYLAWLFVEVDGFSKFGRYTGNGSTNGPVVHMGFKPAFLIVKRSDAASTNGWYIWDNKINPDNPAGTMLYLNFTDAQDSGSRDIDILSNGIKIRATDTNYNTSGGTYIYMAWAESPFKYATAR